MWYKSILSMFLLMFFALSVNSFAQKNNKAMEKQKEQLEMYKTKLNLTDAQYKEMETILKDHAVELKKIKSAAGDDQNARKEAVKKLKTDLTEKIKKVLDKKQLKEFKLLQKEKGKEPKK